MTKFISALWYCVTSSTENDSHGHESNSFFSSLQFIRQHKDSNKAITVNFESFPCCPLDFPQLVKIFFKLLCPRYKKYWPALVLKGHLICFAVMLFIPTGVISLSLTVVHPWFTLSLWSAKNYMSGSCWAVFCLFKGYFCNVRITLNPSTIKYACSHSHCVSRVCVPLNCW